MTTKAQAQQRIGEFSVEAAGTMADIIETVHTAEVLAALTLAERALRNARTIAENPEMRENPEVWFEQFIRDVELYAGMALEAAER